MHQKSFLLPLFAALTALGLVTACGSNNAPTANSPSPGTAANNTASPTENNTSAIPIGIGVSQTSNVALLGQ